jgi:hypothetical protein
MEEYYGNNTTKLADALLCMGILLEHSKTVSLKDKEQVAEKLSMYDDLLESSSIVKRIRAESEAKGEARGELKGARQAVVTIVKGRFPALIELARKRTSRMRKLEAHDSLLLKVGTAPNEESARALLETMGDKKGSSKRTQNTAGSI